MDPDLPLIEALQDGDDTALNTLIERHQQALYFFVFRYLRDETSARDVVAETFVRVYFNAQRFRPKSSVKTWIHSIALNLCRDQARRRKRSPASSGVPSTPDVPDPGAGPAAQAMERERLDSLAEAIESLPPKLKEALILFSIENRSQKEVAELLGITPKTVELRVYHAKQRLREWLGQSKS